MFSNLRRTVLKVISTFPIWGSHLPGGLAGQESDIDIRSVASALEVVRLFNTLELSHKIVVGTYASKSELLHSHEMTRLYNWMEQARNRDPRPRTYALYSALDLKSDQIIPDWRLAIHRSDSRDAYLLTMIGPSNNEDQSSAGSQPDRPMFASDESGVIYEGHLDPIAATASSYAPREKAYPQLAVITLPTEKRGRVKEFIRRVAFSTAQDGVAPATGCTCCHCGTCSPSGQCICRNCGTLPCVWCCNAFCTSCQFCCIAPCACC